MNLKDLVGLKVSFYGVDGNFFKLGHKVFEAVEDENDGYRSMLSTVDEAPEERTKNAIFFKRRLDEVRVEVLESIEGFRLMSVNDGHIWLEIGTSDADCYYPSFVFNYHPRVP
jgi:hypothetical protein